jgi:hypothetical protein
LPLSNPFEIHEWESQQASAKVSKARPWTITQGYDGLLEALAVQKSACVLEARLSAQGNTDYFRIAYDGGETFRDL